jgi:hypothetical protein
MPFLNDIVASLNTNWQNSSLKFIPAPKLQMYEITEPMVEVKEDGDNTAQKRYPSIVTHDGEVKEIMPDDRFHLLLYHRLESISNSVDPTKGYGGSAANLEVANMSVMVFGFRDKLRREAYWLEAALKDGMPDTLTTKDNHHKLIQEARLKPGNSSFDKMALLGREFSEVELNFPNILVFEMKYRIESTWKKGCFTQINNCGCKAD